MPRSMGRGKATGGYEGMSGGDATGGGDAMGGDDAASGDAARHVFERAMHAKVHVRVDACDGAWFEHKQAHLTHDSPNDEKGM